MTSQKPKTIIIIGHFGVGKTTVAMRLCEKFAPNVCVADLDIVNPFFRTSDYAERLKKMGARLIAPEFAGSSLEVSTLSGEIDGAIGGYDGTLILDTGGNPDGAAVLGRYKERLCNRGYICLYVVNRFRPESMTAEAAAGVLKEIEQACGIEATHVFDNTHLMGQEFKPDENYLKKIIKLTKLSEYEI